MPGNRCSRVVRRTRTSFFIFRWTPRLTFQPTTAPPLRVGTGTFKTSFVPVRLTASCHESTPVCSLDAPFRAPRGRKAGTLQLLDAAKIDCTNRLFSVASNHGHPQGNGDTLCRMMSGCIPTSWPRFPAHKTPMIAREVTSVIPLPPDSGVRGRCGCSSLNVRSYTMFC